MVANDPACHPVHPGCSMREPQRPPEYPRSRRAVAEHQDRSAPARSPIQPAPLARTPRRAQPTSHPVPRRARGRRGNPLPRFKTLNLGIRRARWILKAYGYRNRTRGAASFNTPPWAKILRKNAMPTRSGWHRRGPQNTRPACRPRRECSTTAPRHLPE